MEETRKINDLIVYNYDDVPEPSFDGYYRSIDVSLLKYIVSRARGAIEYKNFVDYMKRTMNINKCSFYRDFNMENGFTIELHHAPLTLYDIVETIAKKHFSEDEKDPKIQCWRVEEEAVILHYEFMVGLIPVNPTAHKLIHSGVLKPHPRMIHGNWRKFYKEYFDFMSDEAKTKVEEFIEYGAKDVNQMPDIMKYAPVMISNQKFQSLGSIKVSELIVDQLKSQFMITQNR